MQDAGERRITRVVVYACDLLLSAGAMSLLAHADDLEVIAADTEISRLVPFVDKTKPGVILIDVTPEMTLGLFAALKLGSPEARIVLWGRAFSEEIVQQGAEFGIAGFLYRGCSKEAFMDSLRTVAAGGRLEEQRAAPLRSTRIELTPREGQLVTLLAQGLRNKEIANCLDITEGTVRIYLSKLFLKTGARDRFELALVGLKNAYCGRAYWDGHKAFVTDPDQDRARPVLRSLLLVEPDRRSGYPEAAGL